jgi:hypothetical protein
LVGTAEPTARNRAGQPSINDPGAKGPFLTLGERVRLRFFSPGRAIYDEKGKPTARPPPTFRTHLPHVTDANL